MTMFKPYVDGWFGSGGKELTTSPRPKFPFITYPTPDTYARGYERDYVVYPNRYIPRIAELTSWENVLKYSEDLTQADWTKTNVTPTANVGVGPTGSGGLNKILETVTNGEHRVSQAATLTAAVSEVSVFAVGGLTREWIKLSFTDSAATVFSAFFNVSRAYAISASAGTTVRIVPLGGGFYRCVIRFTPAAGAGTVKVNLSTDGSTISYAGTTSAGVYLFGLQASAGSNPPYISTTTAARTVSAPDIDPDDPLAYLVKEDEPQPYSSEFDMIRRAFYRIPGPQNLPSFIRVNKPGFSGSFPQISGNYVISQPDPAFAVFDAYYRQTVASDSGSAAGVGGVLTGGTYTISFAGYTTAAIAYNATASAVQSALNSIASVAARGGVTVVGDYIGGFTITFASIPYLTNVNIGSIVTSGSVVGPEAVITSYGGTGYGQSFQINADHVASGATFVGGTFTITLFGQTTAALAYNASAGTVQAALNALTNVIARGGLVFQTSPDPILWNSGGQINCAWTFENPLFTVNLGSTLPAGSSATVTKLDAVGYSGGKIGRQQSLTFSGVTVGTRTVATSGAHGITNADTIYVYAGSTYYILAPGTFNVSSTTEIEFDATSGNVAITTDSITALGKRVRTSYTPGPQSVRCNRNSTFYLPGVTPDVATAADIPVPEYQGNQDQMLNAIFEGASTLNYEVGELEVFMGRILSLTVTTINPSDL